MAQLDERTRRDLARLRERGAPSAAAKQRMFAALEAQLGGGPDGGGGESSGSPPELLGDGGASSGLAWAAKVVGATAGLTVGGLVALRLGVEVVRGLSGAPTAVEPQSQAPEQPVEIASVLERDDEAEAAPPEVAVIEAEAAPAVAKRQPSPSPAAPSKPASSTNTLAAELALLEAAHAAASPAAALIELERHLARFPRGELADERELLRIENLCRLDRLAEARKLSERFARERPSSALRRRLASACPALTGSQKN